MKPEDMMDTISQIDDAHIEEFAQLRPRRFLIPWGMVATVAAFCLVIASAVFLRSAGLLPGQTNPTEPPHSSASTTQPPDTTLPTTAEPSLTKADMKAIHTVFLRMLNYCTREMDGSWKDGFLTDSGYQKIRDLLDSVFSCGFNESVQRIEIEIIDLTEDKLATFHKIFSNEDYFVFRNISSDTGQSTQTTVPEGTETPLTQADMQAVFTILTRMLRYCKDEMDESWKPGFKTDSSYQRIRNLLDSLYSCSFNEAEQRIEIQIIDLTHKKIETFRKIFSDEDYISFINIPPDSTLPVETLPPAEPTTPFPDIPEVKYPSAVGKPQVFTNYAVNAGWLDEAGSMRNVSIRLPGLRADSEGAKAINEEIRRRASGNLEELRTAYLGGSAPGTVSMDYETWQTGSILTVVIIHTDRWGNEATSDYYLDTEAGKWLKDTDLAGLSYAEMLYRKCSCLPAHNNTPYPDACALSAVMYLDRDGTLWLRHTCVSADAQTQTVPFDPTAGVLSSQADIYHWLFNILGDGHLGETISYCLSNAFAEDPQLFTEYLAKEVKECRQVVGRHLIYGLTEDEKTAHIALCTSLRNSATDPAVAETAQLLIDAFDDPGAGSIWATCQARFQSITDLDSAMNLSKVLHHCCFEDIRSFISYMYMLDDAYYGYCWQSIAATATEAEMVQLTDVCKTVISDPDATDSEKLAAEALLQSVP